MADSDWVDDQTDDWIDDVASTDDSGILDYIGRAASTVDSYTGAPVRSAVGAAQEGNNPFSAYANQFGEDPGSAPSGKQLAMRAGLSDDPLVQRKNDLSGLSNLTPANMAGFALETVLDPMSLIPAIGTGGKIVGRGLRATEEIAPAMSRSIKDFAEKAAVNATGATGKQAASFADDAGRQLLDRGIVRFGDSQERIAERAGSAVAQANKQIDQSLAALDATGKKVDGNAIYNEVRARIDSMKADPSKADIANLMEKELENLIASTDAKGTSDFGFLEAENIKRGYNRKAGNWMDPEKGIAGKELYQTWRGGVEAPAEAIDPSLATKFKEGKETFGILAPIQEAAERRAATTAQSPVGGFLDAASAAAGAADGGIIGGIVAPIARRVASPRISSSFAVGADKLGDLLKASPQAFGEFAPVLLEAEKRGPQGLAATHFILQQTRPEYRQTFQQVAGDANEGR